MPYGLSEQALAELQKPDAQFATLVTVNVDDDTVWRWSQDDVAWNVDGHAYAAGAASPLIGVVRNPQRARRRLIQVHIADPDRVYEQAVRRAGIVGLPIKAVEHVVIGKRTLEAIWTFSGVTSGLADAPSSETDDTSNTVLVSSGRTVKPGAVETRYSSHQYQRDEVDSLDAIFRRIHQGFDTSWSL